MARLSSGLSTTLKMAIDGKQAARLRLGPGRTCWHRGVEYRDGDLVILPRHELAALRRAGVAYTIEPLRENKEKRATTQKKRATKRRSSKKKAVKKKIAKKVAPDD